MLKPKVQTETTPTSKSKFTGYDFKLRRSATLARLTPKQRFSHSAQFSHSLASSESNSSSNACLTCSYKKHSRNVIVKSILSGGSTCKEYEVNSVRSSGWNA